MQNLDNVNHPAHYNAGKIEVIAIQEDQLRLLYLQWKMAELKLVSRKNKEQ